MKCTVAFLVLSMVILMAEPGEGFVGLLFKGLYHAGKLIHGAIKRRRQRHGEEQVQEVQQDQQLQQLQQDLEDQEDQQDQQVQVDKRSEQFSPPFYAKIARRVA